MPEGTADSRKDTRSIKSKLVLSAFVVFYSSILKPFGVGESITKKLTIK